MMKTKQKLSKYEKMFLINKNDSQKDKELKL